MTTAPPAGAKQTPGLDEFIAAMPKAELHVHLEGAIRPETLLRLARRRRLDLPSNDAAGIRDWFRFRDFEHFVEVYVACSRCLRDPEDFQLVVDEFMAAQARQNILYSEVHFTISTHVAHGANGREVGEAMGEAIAAGRERHGVEIAVIPDIVRNMGVDRADVTLEWALEHRPHGVVALGLSGIERYPAEPFREHFEYAWSEGLPCVAHAGEHAGPESIRSALEVCRARRIGHGIRAVDDPALMDELAASRIPLEVCPSSNVCLGAATDLAAHPIGELLAAGVALSVGSDDPEIFGVDLCEEYRRLTRHHGLEAEDLAALALAAIDQSLLGDEKRARYAAEFAGRFDELGERTLDRGIRAEAAGIAGGALWVDF